MLGSAVGNNDRDIGESGSAIRARVAAAEGLAADGLDRLCPLLSRIILSTPSGPDER
jgi:hypothetical protein